MKRIVVSLIFLLIFSSCEDFKDILIDDFDVTKIECGISGVTYDKDDNGNYVQITKNSNDCPVDTLCNGNNCVENKCTSAQIKSCENNGGQRCEPLTGNCIAPLDYCSLLDEIKQTENLCGINTQGSQRMICDNWRWINYSSCIDTNGKVIENCKDGCIDNAVCTNDTTQNTTTVCGLNNEGFIIEKCENGQWITTEECTGFDICVNDTIQNIDCGFNNNGKQEQKCINGKWENEGNCIDPDVCTIGEKKTEANSCGPNNLGTQKLICINGQWENDVCSKPNNEECKDGCIYNAVCNDGDTQSTTIVCGLNNEGTIIKECQDGQFVNNGLCSGTDVCTIGDEDIQQCGLNDRGQLIANCVNGQWNRGACDDDDVCIDDSLGLYELCQDTPPIINQNGYTRYKCITGQWVIPEDSCIKIQSKMIGNDYTDESNIILMEKDSSNNIYIYIVANINCDGNSENCHYKIYKYDNNLTLLKQSSESIDTGKITSAVLDENGGIIIVGYNYSNVRDLLIERYETTNLTKTHFKTDGTLQEDILTDIYIYNQNEYYVVGYTMGSYHNNYNNNTFDRDLIYAKITFSQINTSINIASQFQLGVTVNKAGDIIPSKILVDDNYVYISGHTNGNLKTGLPSITYDDLFFTRINKQNNTLTENDKFQFSTNGGDGYVRGMKFNNDKTHIYISGEYIGNVKSTQSLDYSPYLFNITLEQTLTSTNSFAFKKVLDTVGADRGEGLYIDNSGNGYIVGYTDGNLPDNQNHLTGTIGEKADIILIKVDSLGNVIWFKQIGTSKSDEAYGVVLDSDKNIFIVGKTRGELGGSNIVGSWNIFISKLSKRLICTIENNQTCQ